MCDHYAYPYIHIHLLSCIWLSYSLVLIVFNRFFLASSCAVRKLSLIFVSLTFRGETSDKMLLLIRKEVIRMTIPTDHRAMLASANPAKL